jgi:hypothetical protein
VEFETVTSTEIEKYLNMMGRRGGEILSILGRLHPTFETYINTMIGKEILITDVNRMAELFEKIYEEDASPEEKAEFRYLRKVRLPYIMGKLNTYFKKVNEIKKVIK